MRTTTLARVSSALLATLLLAPAASATWSIVFVNHATREVAIASATCLANFDLEEAVPVVVVGAGAGAAQSTIDFTGENRLIIRDGLLAGDTPDEILNELRFGAGTTPGRRQYGIAAFTGPAVTWTGGQAGFARFGVVGEVDQISYAIQGNLLAGDEIVLAAEQALRTAKGDSAARLMSAMVAARSLGGDGRCSCTTGPATSCGVPPPGFTKSAHCGFAIVARLGDTTGNCNVANGCATGQYYLNIENTGDGSDPDPVDVLVGEHLAWRASLRGHPDHIRSRVTASAEVLPADGESQTLVTVRLHDLDGRYLSGGGATLAIAPADPAAPPVAIGPVTQNEDGSYTFEVRAGTETGTTELVIVADDGTVRAQLYPNLALELVAPQPLVAGMGSISLDDAQPVPFTISEPGRGGAGYVLVASVAGQGMRQPLRLGSPLGVGGAGADVVATLGRLDAQGRASALWTPAPALLRTLEGARLEWVALSYDGSWRASNTVALEIRP
jgi:hypothetical protein